MRDSGCKHLIKMILNFEFFILNNGSEVSDHYQIVVYSLEEQVADSKTDYFYVVNIFWAPLFLNSKIHAFFERCFLQIIKLLVRLRRFLFFKLILSEYFQIFLVPTRDLAVNRNQGFFSYHPLKFSVCQAQIIGLLRHQSDPFRHAIEELNQLIVHLTYLMQLDELELSSFLHIVATEGKQNTNA